MKTVIKNNTINHIDDLDVENKSINLDKTVTLQQEDSLPSVVSSIGTDEKVLIIDREITLNGELTIPTNLPVEFLGGGKITGSGILNINSNWSQNGSQVFGSFLTVNVGSQNLTPKLSSFGDLTRAVQTANSLGKSLIIDQPLDLSDSTVDCLGVSLVWRSEGNLISNGTLDITDCYITTGQFTIFDSDVTLIGGFRSDISFASIPNHYERNTHFKVKDRTTNRNILVTPSYLTLNIGGFGHALRSSLEMDLGDTESWDSTSTTDWTVASNRAGKDFYLYAVKPSIGSTPGIVLSNDSTYPEGYTEDNSRKIGGFHCLCADIGTNVYSYDNARTDVSVLDNHFVSHDITTSSVKHWLEGYTAGDIIPFSIWDLNHRPVCNPEGMTYDPKADIWVQIYLPSWNGNLIESVYDGNVADGNNGWHQYRLDQQARQQKSYLPEQGEFVSFSLGSPQGINISDSADPGTTGGHTATDGNRIVSLIGVEDATGVFWQWGRESGATSNTGSTYEDAFDTNDLNVEGEHYDVPNPPLLGGHWGSSSSCGSRCSRWSAPSLYLSGDRSSRFLSGSRRHS